MSFLWPNMLWLLLVLPALVALYIVVLRRKKSRALRYASLTTIKAASGKVSPLKRHLPAALLLLALASLLLSLGRPQTYLTLPIQRGTVILAMDISGSMRATDVEPNRLIASQTAARAFVEAQPRDIRIGVVAFAGTSSVVQAPTFDRQEIFEAIERFQYQQGTAVGSGLITSLMTVYEDSDFQVEILPPNPRADQGNPFGMIRDIETSGIVPVDPGSYQSAVIIILTDGETTTGPDPLQAADLAANLGVRVYTVGLGTEEGSVISFFGRRMRVQLDEATLEEIAERTRGSYYRADSEQGLTEIYESIGTQLIEEREETEITFAFAAVGAVLAIAAAVLSLLWFGKLV
ncbi:MAG: VWA domain-containing protein [Alkalispirochaetaceae bacterium]